MKPWWRNFMPHSQPSKSIQMEMMMRNLGILDLRQIFQLKKILCNLEWLVKDPLEMELVDLISLLRSQELLKSWHPKRIILSWKELKTFYLNSNVLNIRFLRKELVKFSLLFRVFWTRRTLDSKYRNPYWNVQMTFSGQLARYLTNLIRQLTNYWSQSPSSLVIRTIRSRIWHLNV